MAESEKKTGKTEIRYAEFNGNDEKELQWAMQQLAAVKKERFFGELKFEFKDGSIRMMGKNETLRPPTV